jgi:uracil-DNA glycosylase
MIRTLTVLKEEYQNCTKCGLCETRTNVVFGYGNPSAQIMIVGEAPGEHDDHAGKPFVGPSGQWLDCYLAAASVNEELIEQSHYRMTNPTYYNPTRVRELLLEDFFFTNTVCCRPPDNRDPTPLERSACKDRLVETIYLVDPVLIIAAGKVAMEVLLGKKVASILAKRGEMFESIVPGKFASVTYPCVPILHPAFLMRNQDEGIGSYSEKTYNDIISVMQILDEFNLLHYGITPPPNRPKQIKVDDRVINQPAQPPANNPTKSSKRK